MAYTPPVRLEGLSDAASRAVTAELRALASEVAILRALRDEVLDRRAATTINAQPGQYVRALAGSAVLLPAARPCKGQHVTVIVESAPVTIQASDGSTVNDFASVSVTTTGSVLCTSTGDEWWTGAAGGAAAAGAPVAAEYIVGAAHAGLTAERVATSSTSVSVDLSVAGQAAWTRAALTGAISAAANANATLFAGIRLNNVAQTARAAINLVNSTSITPVIADDAGNNKMDVSLQRAALTGDVTASTNSNSTALRLAVRQSLNATAQVDNFSLNGTTNSIQVTLTGNQTITGITGGTPGRTLFVHNLDATDTLTFSPLDAASSAANRFLTPSGQPYVLRPDESVMMLYLPSVWVLIAVDREPFTSTQDGMAPASGGGTVNFLRADGTWTDPLDGIPELSEQPRALIEEFFGAESASLTGNESGQWAWNSSGISSIAEVESEEGHFGIRRFSIAEAGHGYAFASSLATLGQININDITRLVFRVRIPTEGTQTDLADRAFGIGLAEDASDTAGTTPNLGGNGLVFWFNAAALADWRVRRETGSTGVSDNTQTAVLDDWVECVLTNAGSGTWSTVVNGVDYGTLTGVAEDVNLVPVIWIDNDDTDGDAYFDVDTFEIYVRAPGSTRYT